MDAQREAYIERCRNVIAKHGRMVQGVIGQCCYTIGNCSKGLPELLIIGPFTGDGIVWVLNALSDKMVESGKPLDEGLVDLGAKYPVYVLPAHDDVKDEHTCLVDNVCGTNDYAVLQVVVCDPQGRFPWDAGCDPAYVLPVRRRLDA